VEYANNALSLTFKQKILYKTGPAAAASFYGSAHIAVRYTFYIRPALGLDNGVSELQAGEVIFTTGMGRASLV
jgi:hypothetical protein